MKLSKVHYITIGVGASVAIMIAIIIPVVLLTGKSVKKPVVRAVVVTNGEQCAGIGRNILKKGGSAVDAAIGALICDGVEMPQSMGLGGGFLMVIYRKSDNKVDFLIARERAPGAATEDMYKANSSLAREGILSVAVPGELRGYGEAYKYYGGKLPWKDLVQPTIDMCTEGILVTPYFANVLKRTKYQIEKDPGLKSAFVNPKTGDVYKAGDRYKLPRFAETLKIISEEGGEAMHNGSLTKRIVDEIKKLGGIITEEDMRNYRAEWTRPVTINLPEGRTLYTAPLPGSGLLLAFMLNILKGLIVNANPKDVVTYHRIVEAFKFGYGYRSKFGDPDFLPEIEKELSKNLVSDEYAEKIRKRIRDDKTSQKPEDYSATAANILNFPYRHGTANLVVLASNGDAVAVTSTINLYFGSGVMLQDTGFILNDEMDDASTPGMNNSFGLPPSVNNYIAPHKRPLSSMSPSIVVKDGYVELAAGAAGGSKITTAVALLIIRHLWFNKNIQDAVNEKRFHHQLVPMEVQLEASFKNSDTYISEGLEKIGHIINFSEADGFSAATALSNKSGTISGSFDRRRQGASAYLES